MKTPRELVERTREQIRRRPLELRGKATDVQRRQIEASQQLVTEKITWMVRRLMGWS